MLKAPWKIIHLELTKEIPDLIISGGYQGILAIFCWHGIPLGESNFGASELPINRNQVLELAVKAIAPAVGSQILENSDFENLRELREPLKLLQEKWEESINDIHNNISVSVIICTRDRPEQLKKCLRSLENSTISPQEILVIDNAPNSDITKLIIQEFSQVQYILEPRPGLSIARNTGIHHAKSEIIAFTDDDVEVHPQWLANIQKAFKHPQIMSVTGIMLPAQLETEAEVTFHQAFDNHCRWKYEPVIFGREFFIKNQSKGVPVWNIGAGANMAFRSKIFHLVGGFNEILGAGASGCSEDSEMWYRILAEGWDCLYEPTAVVYHYHRNNIDSLQQQMYQYMRGHITALLIQFKYSQHWGNLRRTFISLPKYYLQLYIKKLVRQFFRGDHTSYLTLNTEITGCLAGIKYYLHKSYLTRGK